MTNRSGKTCKFLVAKSKTKQGKIKLTTKYGQKIWSKSSFLSQLKYKNHKAITGNGVF